MNKRLWLAGTLISLLSACVQPPASGPQPTVSAKPSGTPSDAPSAAVSPSAAPASPSPAAPLTSATPGPSGSPSVVGPLNFGPQVKLIGGNGDKGDFAGITDSGLPEKRAMDVAVAVVPTAADEIYFLEGDRGRIALWSAPFVRQDGPSYRIPNVVNTSIRRGGDMIAYKDGVLVTDTFAHQVLFVRRDGSQIVFAGTGTGGSSGDGLSAINAQLDSPIGLAMDTVGNVYVADSNNNVVRRVDTSGRITTFAGEMNQPAELGAFASGGKRLRIPRFLAVDKQDNLYVYDSRNQIRRVKADKSLELVAGSGVFEQDIATQERPGVGLGQVLDMAVGPDGWLYYGDATNHVIRRINISLPFDQLRSVTVAGSGKANGFPYYDDSPTACTISLPTAIGFDAKGGLYYFEGLTFRWITVPVQKP